jgi:hypothetical protein
MSARRKDSPLADAAAAFDDALEAHTRAAELFVRSPLATTKHLDRVNELLTEIAAAEEALRESGTALATQVAAARDRQEELAKKILERLPEVQERNSQLRTLLDDFSALGAEAGELNTRASSMSPKDLAAELAGLAVRAETLAATARAAGFEELAVQAHALHQRLAASAKKLSGATL